MEKFVSRFVSIVFFNCLMITNEVDSHGRLIEPPSRASMWRYGFNTPPNYNDHELYCGGFSRQWARNGGKCGICGDAWDLPQPRPHEAGGKYGQGLISRKYKSGSQITIRVELTASHRGYFEFRLCPNNNSKRIATQKCLDKYLLRKVKPPAAHPENYDISDVRFFPGPESNKIHEIRYMLPERLWCSQCVLQWRYVAGNNWGACPNGTEMVGCGPQEEFRACSDIAIETEEGKFDGLEEEQGDNNEVSPVDETATKDEFKGSQDENATWLSATLFMAILSLVFALAIYTVLYLYYYQTSKLKRWFGPPKANKSAASSTISPVPPPRTKKVIATIGFQGVPDNLV